MAVANRVSCTSPCAVYFDATSAESRVVQPSDGLHERMYYDWDFGDPESGNWARGAQSAGANTSKNKATGMVAAHVFELPVDAGTGQNTMASRTYRATVSVRPSKKASPFFYFQDITVHAPTRAPYYVSSSAGNDSNDGSLTRPFATIQKGLSVAQPGDRVLLRRDDSWAFNGFAFDVGADVQVGAYGSGANPKITLAGDFWEGIGLRASSSLSDIDITILGYSLGAPLWLGEPGVLLLRFSLVGAGKYYTYMNGADHNYLVDSTFIGTKDNYNGCMSNGGTHFVVLGSLISQPEMTTRGSQAHVLYGQNPDHNIVSNSTFYSIVAPNGLPVQSLRESPASEVPVHSFTVITDNLLSQHMELLHVQPNISFANHIEHILIERNAATRVDLGNSTKKVVVRSNNLSGIARLYDPPVYPREMPTEHFYIYDNVFSGFTVSPNLIVSNVYAYNNMVNGQCEARGYTSDGSYPADIAPSCGG